MRSPPSPPLLPSFPSSPLTIPHAVGPQPSARPHVHTHAPPSSVRIPGVRARGSLDATDENWSVLSLTDDCPQTPGEPPASPSLTDDEATITSTTTTTTTTITIMTVDKTVATTS
ncbi:hypothetical protein O3P69_006271 [Scylla paramamosain]|uniref:Uncharacterized protein n=1 Tax=Scylla paramamosain TaxID=85552 RepID=A0AAW0U1P0_SCYPA